MRLFDILKKREPEEEKAKNEVEDNINSLKQALLNDRFFEDLDY